MRRFDFCNEGITIVFGFGLEFNVYAFTDGVNVGTGYADGSGNDFYNVFAGLVGRDV